jgi:hypothetical protein
MTGTWTMKRKSKNRKSKWSSVARADGTFDFEALSDAQKEDLYRECQAVGATGGVALSAAQRRLHAQARRRGRPRKGQGARIVSLSIERDLLRRAQRLAEAQGISRSDLFSRGLRAVLAMAGAA